MSATNGGFVKIKDRDLCPEPTDKRDECFTDFLYNGTTTSREFEYHWDLHTPYHCSEKTGTSCTPFLYILSDITSNVSVIYIG